MSELETSAEAGLGEGGLPPELLRQIKGIHVRARRLVTDSMAGEYESAFKGRGMEFEEVRAYQPGDDVRHIDWNVTARTGAPFIKVHREERELTVMLLVDVSSSGEFGSGEKLKREVAAEIAATLAWTAIRSHDRVGLIVFSDRVERYIPPKKGRAHVWRVVREILTFRPGRARTDLPAAIDFLGKVSRRRMVGFVISDFLDAGWEEGLRVLAARHDLTAIPIGDRREEELPACGLIELEDAETGDLLLVDTSDRKAMRELGRLAQRDRRRRSEALRAAGIGEMAIAADRPWVDTLIRFFHERERR